MMTMRYYRLLGWIVCAATLGAANSPARGDDPPSLVVIGKVKPRSAKEIAASNWSVGGETLDRDFAVYENYKKYLGPLGAKGIRLQAGWAKCEKKPGDYDWAWLDAIVDDAIAQGVRPWLETSYGNPIYQGGGGVGLGGGFPRSAEALAAWDNWVRALVKRYKDRVDEWEIWNEPDLTKSNEPADYGKLFIRTAEIVRGEQPAARIYALALAGRLDFAEKFFEQLKEQGKLNLVDAVTVHGYPKNPDDTSSVDQMRKLLARYAPKVVVRQGETGAPSKLQTKFALANMPWSETTQAKWNLRRMLAHRAKDVPFNMFTLMDMHYMTDGKLQMNWKGLLAANANRTVSHAKPAYYAAQRVFAIFDDTVERVGDFTGSPRVKTKLAAAGYRKKPGNEAIVAVWLSNGEAPVDSHAKTPLDLIFSGVKFSEPVYVDLLTGDVAAIPRDRWSADGNATTFKQMPVYDSPILIAEKSAIATE